MLVFDSSALRPDRPYNPGVQAHRFRLFRVRSPLLAESLLFSLPAGTEMVHFPALPSRPYEFRPGYGGMTRRGFPHSDIPGSKLVCSSPRLFAAYRVLHRLLAPRHSPYALSSLTIGIQELTSKFELCNIELLRQSLFPPSRLETLRVICGSEKLPFAGYSVEKEHRLSSKFKVRSSKPTSATARRRKLQSGSRASSGSVLCPCSNFELRNSNFNVVENTGLEPVTSWLQTRRSPS